MLAISSMETAKSTEPLSTCNLKQTDEYCILWTKTSFCTFKYSLCRCQNSFFTGLPNPIFTFLHETYLDKQLFLAAILNSFCFYAVSFVNGFIFDCNVKFLLWVIASRCDAKSMVVTWHLDFVGLFPIKLESKWLNDYKVCQYRFRYCKPTIPMCDQWRYNLIW